MPRLQAKQRHLLLLLLHPSSEQQVMMIRKSEPDPVQGKKC
jgi:hypothetical protein